MHAGKRNESQVRCVQHKFHTHEHDDGVSAHQNTNGSDTE
jgi:hypothetical protein